MVRSAAWLVAKAAEASSAARTATLAREEEVVFAMPAAARRASSVSSRAFALAAALSPRAFSSFSSRLVVASSADTVLVSVWMRLSISSNILLRSVAALSFSSFAALRSWARSSAQPLLEGESLWSSKPQ